MQSLMFLLPLAAFDARLLALVEFLAIDDDVDDVEPPELLFSDLIAAVVV